MSSSVARLPAGEPAGGRALDLRRRGPPAAASGAASPARPGSRRAAPRTSSSGVGARRRPQLGEGDACPARASAAARARSRAGPAGCSSPGSPGRGRVVQRRSASTTAWSLRRAAVAAQHGLAEEDAAQDVDQLLAGEPVAARERRRVARDLVGHAVRQQVREVRVAHVGESVGGRVRREVREPDGRPVLAEVVVHEPVDRALGERRRAGSPAARPTSRRCRRGSPTRSGRAPAPARPARARCRRRGAYQSPASRSARRM